ncbi:gas vesicle protein GvpO [Streptomyces sp. NPDC059680]
MLGRTPESVSALRPTEEGWYAEVEAVEPERAVCRTRTVS